MLIGHTIFDWSTVLVEVTAVTCVVTLEWAPMLLAGDTVLVGPAHFLGLLGNLGVNGLHLALPFSPFWLVQVGRLWIEIGIVLDVSNTSNNALVLTGVVFLDRSYWACHLAGHMRSR